MKKYFIMAAIAAVTLASCSTADDEVATNPSKTTDPVAVNLSNTLSKATTRATTGLQNEQIVSGVQVGVSAFLNGKTASAALGSGTYAYINAPYTAGGDGTLTVGDNKVYYPTDGSHVDIYAYAPYASDYAGPDINSNTLGFSVQADQTTDVTDGGYLKSDFIWASLADQASSTTAKALIFSHELARISVTLSKEEGSPITNAELESAQIDILNTFLGSTVNLKTGVVTLVNTGENVAVKTITAKATTTSALSAAAIIIPQTVTKGTQFIKVTIGTTAYVYSIPTGEGVDDMAFAGGKDYQYGITVSPTGIKVSSSINNWGTTTDQTGTAAQQ